ncbi:MAG: EAL domain-containing protein [Pontibacterium sp.]
MAFHPLSGYRYIQEQRLSLFILLLISACSFRAEAVEFTPEETAFIRQHPGIQALLPALPHLTPQEQSYLVNKQQITACIDPNWMPYEGFINGKHIGISADYLEHFSKQLNIPIQVVKTTSWKESLQYARARRCDILPLASDRAERREFMNFTPAYLETSLALATRNDAWFYSDFSEIQGHSIGIIRGYSPAKVIKKNYPDINLVEFDSIDEGLNQVRQGKLLGFLDAVPALSYRIQRSFHGELKISGKFDYDWHVGIAARNDEPHLVSIFNKAIAATPASVDQKIRNNWLAVRYEKAADYSLLWQTISLFVFILILLSLRYFQVYRYQKAITQKNHELAQINIQLAEQTNAAKHMAFHDLLTGLPNRARLMENLEHAMQLAQRLNNKVALLFMDLDRFKYVNDSLGHPVGDELLKVVSNRIRVRLRNSDTLARIGGDEFVILLESLENETIPAKIAQEIIDIIRQPMDIGGYQFNISASIGIALYPSDGTSPDTLIKHADNAMYQAKERGRNHYRYYTPQLSEQTDKRLKTEFALREALNNNQFSLVFQPIVNLKSLEVSHAEALIRWNHPEMGPVSPEYFIPIAEENGFINEIGIWVMKEACKAYKSWLAQGLSLNAIAVNVSSIQFQKGNLAKIFRQILDEEGLPASAVEIEITERYLMDQTEQTIGHLNSLREAGHPISVDDFGVGYSSMSYMKRLPLSVIKIDRSFIRDIPKDRNDQQISKAIIALSHSLGYRVTAEGVEHAQQLSFLERSRCDFAQGYFFSRPVTNEQFFSTVLEVNSRLKQRRKQALAFALM